MPPLSAPETLRADHDVTQFDCGKPALTNWLRQRAQANQRHGFTAVVVVHDAQRVVGYYGLAPVSVDPSHLPRPVRTGQPPNPIPCLLLGQLATDLAYAGQGIGSMLLRHALTRAVAGAALVGGRALMIHTLDDKAAAFWRRRGFISVRDEPLLLFRSIGDIAATVAAMDPFP
ncbi:MAG: GNAT family N-acetyltransferase [Rhodospirillales bacterium]